MTFREAVEAVTELAAAYRPGLQALESHDRRRIMPRNTRKLAGSVYLEQALAPTHPHQTLWDYGVGYRSTGGEQVVWIEVHPANSAHVDDMLRKLDWLRSWLRSDAPDLAGMTAADGAYIWLATGTVALPATDRRRRLIAQRGLRLVSGRLELRDRAI